MTKKTLAPKKSSSFFRNLVISLVLIGLLGVFLFHPLTKALLDAHLSRATGLPVEIGELDFSLTRPQFTMKDLKFLNPDGFSLAELASLSEVKVLYAPSPAIVGRFNLKKVTLDFKELRVVRNESGKLNLSVPSPVSEGANTMDEVLLNLHSVTYTDLSQGMPVQKTFELGLENALFRNVKGVAGILEIVVWEVLKRTGIEAEEAAPAPASESVSGPPVLEPSQPTPAPAPSPAPAAVDSSSGEPA